MLNLRQAGPGPFQGGAIRLSVCRIALSALLLTIAVACRVPAPRPATPEILPPPAAGPGLSGGSYDWRVLVIAPFGSALKDIPAALHEVLLFRDDAHGGAAADAAADAECYASDAPAPRFAGSIPDEYLLCFRQDRLSRIQASVRLPAVQAPDTFAAACAGWSKNAASTAGAEAHGAEAPGVGATGVETPGVATRGAGASGVGAQGIAAPSAEAQGAGACEGRDGAVHFRGRLEEEPGQADIPQSESVLSITLDGVPNP